MPYRAAAVGPHQRLGGGHGDGHGCLSGGGSGSKSHSRAWWILLAMSYEAIWMPFEARGSDSNALHGVRDMAWQILYCSPYRLDAIYLKTRVQTRVDKAGNI
jgi:hypothetical protein